MLKYSTGRSKPGWGKVECRPIWWPNDVPWANVRSDVRSEEEKKKVFILIGGEKNKMFIHQSGVEIECKNVKKSKYFGLNLLRILLCFTKFN